MGGVAGRRQAAGGGSPHRIERRLRAGVALAVPASALLLASLAAPAGALNFADAAEQAGLRFERVSDSDEESKLLGFMGGGACWLDHDRDGVHDVFLVNGWTLNATRQRALDPRSALFRNLGDGTFIDVSRASGLDLRGWTQGCSAADYDADGWEDVLVVGFGLQWLYRNQGDGTFANASAQAGITAEGKCGEKPCWGTSAAWADYDRDGCLDLYVVNFIEYDLASGLPQGPTGATGQANQLYHSNCDGTFEDVSEASGADGQPGPDHAKDWAVSWLDYDGDDWLDIYVASDGVPNILYRNNGDGTFTDKAQEAGVADLRNSMGLTVGDCDDDGWEDLFFTHYQADDWAGQDGFYTNRGDGTFEDHSGEPDLDVAQAYVRWGAGFADFDNDGDLDLHAVSGHTEMWPEDPDEPQLLWVGDGDCHWDDARATAGAALRKPRSSRGTAYADYDLDGDLDIVVVNQRNQSAMLLRNGGAPWHWLEVELLQPGPNPRGLQAQVNVTLPSGEVLHRRVNPSQSLHSSGPAMVHFGLGSAETVNLTVRWPDLAEDTFTGVRADERLRVVRAEARLQNDTLAPTTALDVEGLSGEAGWWRSPVNLGLAARDRGVTWASGVLHTYLSLDGGPVLEDPAPLGLGEGPHVLRVWSEDAERNREPPRTELVGVDTQAPASAAALEGALLDGWYRGPVRVALACADATSGVGALAWRLDEEPSQPYRGPFALTRPGRHVFAWSCRDAAGNLEPEHSLALAIDLGHPETLARLEGIEGSAGWWRSAVNVTLAAEGGLHDVVATHVSVDGGPWAEASGELELQGEGLHELRFWSEDSAGRQEPERSLRVAVDTLPPGLALEVQGPHVDSGGLLVVGRRHGFAASAHDDTSGLARLQAARGRDPLHDYEGPVRFAGEGFHRLRLVARDEAGNEASLSQRLWLDLTPPPLAVARPGDQTVNVAHVSAPLLLNPTLARAVLVGPVPMEAGVGYDIAGVRNVSFAVDGAAVAEVREPPWVWVWSLPPGDLYREVRYRVEDNVGNARLVRFWVWAAGTAGPAPAAAALPPAQPAPEARPGPDPPAGEPAGPPSQPPAAAAAALPRASGLPARGPRRSAPGTAPRLAPGPRAPRRCSSRAVPGRHPRPPPRGRRAPRAAARPAARAPRRTARTPPA